MKTARYLSMTGEQANKLVYTVFKFALNHDLTDLASTCLRAEDGDMVARKQCLDMYRIYCRGSH